jgi:hypothetical protein
VTNLLQRSRRPSTRHDELHSFQGNQYWNMPLTTWRPNEEGISSDFANLVRQGYQGNAVVFACELTRTSLFSEARFKWRRLSGGRPGDLFGTPDLNILERPWPGGTTGHLLSRMLTDADFGGTAFVGRPKERADRLMRMRPDWVTIVLGSQDEPDEANYQMDADFLGVIYHPGGQGSGRPVIPLLADEVAMWSPIPDPLAAYRGTSWLSPIFKEIDADAAATTHKLMFFKNGATPQLIIVLPAAPPGAPTVKRQNLQDFIARMDEDHAGAANAYRTMVLGGGAVPHIVGKDLQQLDFKATQGAGESRIAAVSGVHPVVAALSEGMAGSSLNAGNFNAAKRLVADRTLRPLWRGACAALANIVEVPSGAELWFDERDISFLQDDRQDAADIEQTKASTIVSLSTGGFTRRSAIAAVEAQDMNLLVEDPNWVSVQLQPSGGPAPTAAANGNGARQLIAAGQG